MLQLALTLVLASSPSPVDAWANQACPAPARPADSPLESKARQAERTECLKRAMNRAVDAIVVPLKKQGAPAFREWMALQADYNRWMADACAAQEEAHWVDLATGKRAMGSGYGAAETQCLQQQYTWRGFFADALARGDGAALEAALAGASVLASERGEVLRVYQRLTQEVAARAPEQVPEEDAGLAERLLSREDWSHYNARLERAASGPEGLARRQCGLLALPVAECEQRLRGSLVAQLDFRAALPAPVPAPLAPPEPTAPTGAAGMP